MSDKDFLSQFSGENKKPDSFKEEERIPVSRPKVSISLKLLIAVALSLIVISGLLWFFFLRARIVMPDFVGQNKTDVSAWVKQYDIETSGIIFKEEYDFDTSEGTILSQDVAAGKKVKENVKITFAMSLGPDPEESVDLPDLWSMDKEEIEDWIKENKLTKSKVITQYSDTIEAGEIINYELKNVEEDDFVRSSTLTVYVSKGPAPASTVIVEDFKDKSYSEAESWAKAKKIELVKAEAYSNTVAEGLIINQSIAAGQSMKEGEKLKVVVSKGKGLEVPDFTSMNESSLNSWISANPDFSVSIGERYYSNSSAYVLSQSVTAGTWISQGEHISLAVNLGNGFYISDEGIDLQGSADKLNDWADEARSRGIYVCINKTYADSSELKGTIISCTIHYKDTIYSEVEKLPLNVAFDIVVSTGSAAPSAPEDFYLSDDDLLILNNEYIDHIRDWFASMNARGYSLTCEFIEEESSAIDPGFPISHVIASADGQTIYPDVAKLPVDAHFTFHIAKAAAE